MAGDTTKPISPQSTLRTQRKSNILDTTKLTAEAAATAEEELIRPNDEKNHGSNSVKNLRKKYGFEAMAMQSYAGILSGFLTTVYCWKALMASVVLVSSI